MDTPTEAFDHLSRYGLDALLDMGTASFWRRAQPPVPRDEETFDRAFEARMIANKLLGVDESDNPHGCQSAFKFDPVSASDFDPFERRV
jgi:hypothetical protein